MMVRFELGNGLFAAALALILCGPLAAAPNLPDKKVNADTSEKPDGHKFEPFKPEAVTSNGTVTVDGPAIPYQAIAGTLVVHPKGWDDVPRDPNHDKGSAPGDEGDGGNPTAEASMFYVAYFKNGAGARPVTFVYNGGPGSASFWLHMGA